MSAGAVAGGPPIRVLVVEDDPVASAAHAMYVGRVPGFTVVGTAPDGRTALRLLEQVPVDLVLLDFHLPDMHGLTVAQSMRVAGVRADVLAVTSVRDVDAVRAAVAQGVLHYVLKPFTAQALRDKLERYAQFTQQLRSGDTLGGQSEVDGIFAAMRGVDATALPSGMSEETLRLVLHAVQEAPAPRSAREVAEATGTSRVTARRYLEHLAEAGAVRRDARYGGAGRPEVEYRWVEPGRPRPQRPQA